MNRLPILLVSAFTISLAAANDQIRDVQGELKSQGFYYGEVNGTEGTETTAAIRRFQIRNGLAVTGKINAETLAALGLGQKGAAPSGVPAAPPPANERPMPPQANPAPAPMTPKPAPDLNEPPPLMKPGKDFLRNPEPGEEPARPPRRISPDDPSVIEPPAPIPGPIHTPFSMLFRGTPYDEAPRAVQFDTLRRAQALMVAKRFYRGPIDGIPGPATSEALFAYQEAQGLNRTGRLDMETLAEMHLLPRTLPGAVPLNPFYNPNRRRPPSVTLDYWAR